MPAHEQRWLSVREEGEGFGEAEVEDEEVIEGAEEAEGTCILSALTRQDFRCVQS